MVRKASPFLVPWISRAAAAISILALAACQEAEVAEIRPDPVVQVVTVQPISLVETRTYSGVIRPRTEVSESFRIGGKLIERLKGVGDPVAAGEVVARLDPTDLDLSVQQAEASVSAAKSNLARATADERRSADLRAKGHVSDAEYDGRRLALDEAAARLATAEKGLDLARNQRSYADLRASSDGIVSAAPGEPGQVVAQGSPVLVVARQDEKEVLVSIPESRLSDLTGSTATVTLWADGKSFPARLREVSPEADPATRTYAVRYALPEADEGVRFGMTATLSLAKGDPTPVIRVPSTAVLEDGRGPVVFTVEDGTRLARQPVQVARFESDQVILTEGLSAGDQIVSLGVDRLQDGLAVRTVDAN